MELAKVIADVLQIKGKAEIILEEGDGCGLKHDVIPSERETSVVRPWLILGSRPGTGGTTRGGFGCEYPSNAGCIDPQ